MKWYKKAKKIMIDKKIKQDDLIEVLGVKTRGAVGHYLTGRRQPDPDQMKALADKLECSLDELMEEGDPDPLQLQINKIIRSTEKAMIAAGGEFSEDERTRLYRLAFSVGLDLSITDDQLNNYLSGFVKK